MRNSITEMTYITPVPESRKQLDIKVRDIPMKLDPLSTTELQASKTIPSERLLENNLLEGQYLFADQYRAYEVPVNSKIAT